MLDTKRMLEKQRGLEPIPCSQPLRTDKAFRSAGVLEHAIPSD